MFLTVCFILLIVCKIAVQTTETNNYKIDVLGGIFKTNVDAIKTHDKLDLIFLIDASSSVGEINFRSELMFVKKLLSDVVVDYDHARIAVVTFGSKNKVIKGVDEITYPHKQNNKCLLLNKQLGEVKYTGGETYTFGAFLTAQNIFNHSRNSSKLVLFLITDGYSNGGDPIPLAHELKRLGVTIFTIGVRNGNIKELQEIATQPPGQFCYILESFREFEALARRALHVDIKSGDYIPLGTEIPCERLCTGGNCCDKNALCTCGTSTGHFTCLCKLGYYGSGLKDSCLPCLSGTYAAEPNLCLPCPDVNHITIAPDNEGIKSCKCKNGYRETEPGMCKVIECPKITPPEHGYFVKGRECGNILNTACGVRCEVGYNLVGSSIRLCRANGNWSGTHPQCQVRTCSATPTPGNGSILCTHFDLDVTYNNTVSHLPVDTVCSFSCNSGWTLVGSEQRTCLPLSQWDGLRVTCRQLMCHKLSKIPNGKIEPEMCTTAKQEVSSKCRFQCEKGFSLLGDEEAVCLSKATWSNKFSPAICKDSTPPSLVCPSDVVANSSKGQNFGMVSWNVPNATDNSNMSVFIWIKPAITNITNFKFRIGQTMIRYFAKDVTGNMAKCNFTVKITDSEPPTIENCFDPVPFLSTDKDGVHITWDEPIIHDNSGSVTVNKSHAFGFFNIGTTIVTYTATDPSNNINTCSLKITVQEALCERLPDPVYGRSECNSLNSGLQCIVTCQEGYAIPISAPYLDTFGDEGDNYTEFMCENSDPIWFSQGNNLFPDCTATAIPINTLQKGTISVESLNDDICNNTYQLSQLENEIKNDLYHNFFDNVCPNCVNVTKTECENVSDSYYAETSNNRIKRGLISNNPKRIREGRNRINMAVEVSHSVKSLHEARLLENSTEYKVVGVTINESKATCRLGYISKKMKCVQCPAGTFHHTAKGVCQSCELGFYNDRVGQIGCTVCPINHSTAKFHSKSIEDCKAFCPPGTYARRRKVKTSRRSNMTVEHTSLMPYCRPCPMGTFQGNFGQLSCRKCPDGYTTPTMRTSNKNDCFPVPIEGCANSSTECSNNGTCMPEVNHYSCTCGDDFYGTHCEVKSDHCLTNQCLNEATCVSNTSQYTCLCANGYSGRYCQEHNDICSQKCKNGGTCLENSEENCLCPAGFGGDFCENLVKHCSDDLCDNSGTCIEQLYGYKCLCVNGFIGKRCNILPCDYNPCRNNTVCINIVERGATKNSFRCTCPNGFDGQNCLSHNSLCVSHPCLNNGKCLITNEGYKCECPYTFSGLRCEHKLEDDFILKFPRSGTTDFVKLSGFTTNLTEVTTCLWMQTSDSFNYGTLLSYATFTNDNAFTITDYTGLVVYVNGKHVVTDIFLNDGFWHFLCVNWRSTEGTYNIYVDGKLAQNGTGLATMEVIQGGGKMVIGQEQDALGGRFSQSEAFLGKIAYFDLWSTTLTHHEINELMSTCNSERYGDLYAWPTLKNFVHGDIEVLNSTFCINCSMPTLLKHGSTETIKNVAFYKCDTGYELNNKDYQEGRRCNKASKWVGNAEPFCKRIYCGYPEYVPHCDIRGKDHYFSGVVTYTCYAGYHLEGSNNRTCLETGNWSYASPVCAGIQCKSFAQPKHSNIRAISDASDEAESNFDIGIQIEVTCASGYELEGPKIITCLENGTWDDNPAPKCNKKRSDGSNLNLPCPVDTIPPAPSNGYVALESLYAFGNGTKNTIEYKCRYGYRLKGRNSTTCILDGYWTETSLSCEVVVCGKQPVFPHMVLKYSHLNNGTYYFGNMATFTCIDGYTYFGNNVIRCLASGRWTRMQARCSRKSCYKPVVKEATMLEGNSYLYGEELALICNKTKYVIKCGSDGNWFGNRGTDC